VQCQHWQRCASFPWAARGPSSQISFLGSAWNPLESLHSNRLYVCVAKKVAHIRIQKDKLGQQTRHQSTFGHEPARADGKSAALGLLPQNQARKELSDMLGSPSSPVKRWSLELGGGDPLSTRLPIPQVPENGFRVSLLSDPPGSLEVPGLRNARVSIHVGPPVHVLSRRAGFRHRGMAVHGDIDIIPAGVPSYWEMSGRDVFLGMSISQEILDAVASELDIDPRQVEIRNRFQTRDPQLENIAWALKAELECGYPCGRVYFDSLAVSVAARLLRCHSSVSREPKKATGRLSAPKLKQVLCFIEENLGQCVSLADVASVAGVSVSHFKTLFRESVGLPLHQYLIRRRVERAKDLIGENKLSISQIAFETGFSHQSHLARHMRRVLGVSPKVLRGSLR